MKRSLPLLLLALVATAMARPVNILPYDKLTEEADLIVIATPVAVRDTEEKTAFPGVQRGGPDNHGQPVPAVGVETTFEVLSVLKGDKALKKIVFHHLRHAGGRTAETNPLMLVSFDPKEKQRYLLFLTREPDGRYVSLTGQTDPAGAVKSLGTYP